MQELEVLLSDGRIVVATPENEHRDLFFGFPNSYGTLGYALRIRIGLIPVKPFVKLTHQRYTDPNSYFRAMSLMCRDGTVDFVDGTMFDGHNLYMTTGEFVDHAEWTSDYTYLQMYYRSVAERNTDYLTTHDYLWRWDTDWFWCSKHFLLQYPLMRRLWGKERLNSAVYWKLWKRFHASSLARVLSKAIEGPQEVVIQDVEIPIEQAPKFAQFFNEEIGIRPVWICPVAARDPSASYVLYPMDSQGLYVNFGFWDAVRSEHGEGYFNKLIETKVRQLGGHKSLYSASYYSKEEFHTLYNGDRYRRLKARYDPKGRLKELYEKCVLRQ
jgi:FAD/FMN-containing dehydrogenase